MKRLQCNFTTPEQSKRLLELGIPTWTSDCFYNLDNLLGDTPTIIPFQLDVNDIEWDKVNVIPCWSVGRLIEILTISFGNIDWIEWCAEQPPIETILAEIEAGVTQSLLDFSKSEE